MMNKSMHSGLVLLLALSVKAAVVSPTAINIPDGSFEGVSASLNGFLVVGTITNGLGSWTAKLSDLVSIGGSVQSGTATAVGGPAPDSGNYELAISVPVGVGVTASVSQVLTNKFIPNSTYILSVALNQGNTLGLMTNSSLSIMAGTNHLASLAGSNLLSVAGSGNGLQTVSLTYRTGGTVPTNGIGISLAVSSVANIGGTVFADNFKMSMTPNQVRLTGIVPSGGTNSNITISGGGGAPNQTFQIITTTDLTRLTTNWVPLMTNQFDTNGNFSLQFAIDRTIPCRFFSVMLPAP